MQPLLRRIQTDPAFGAVVEGLTKTRDSVQAEGLVAPARPLFVAALHAETRRPVLVRCPTDDHADKLHQALVPILGEDAVRLFPSSEMTLYERYRADADAAADRLRVLGELSEGAIAVTVAPAAALLHDIMPRARFRALSRDLRVGAMVEREPFLRWLSDAGYRRVELVEAPGEFAARGGIVDVYPPTLAAPVRAEFWGDQLESLRRFDPGTQRSTEQLGAVKLVPADEMTPAEEERVRAAEALERMFRDYEESADEAHRRLARTLREDAEALRLGKRFEGMAYYGQLLFGESETLLDYLPGDALLVLDEPLRTLRACEETVAELTSLHEQRVARGELPPLPRSAFRSVESLTELLA